jgi:hypothetical protein
LLLYCPANHLVQKHLIISISTDNVPCASLNNDYTCSNVPYTILPSSQITIQYDTLVAHLMTLIAVHLRTLVLEGNVQTLIAFQLRTLCSEVMYSTHVRTPKLPINCTEATLPTH